MSEILLTTKIHIPSSISTLVERPSLIEKLETGHTTTRLTLVCAPTGSGKSTVLSQWIRQQEYEMKTVWLSLDEGDNDLVRFIAYLVAGLRAIDDTIGQQTEALLQSPQSKSFEILLTPLLNDISTPSKPIILILDDYHVIHDLHIHDAMNFLIKYKPMYFHIVIATRHDPPLPLGQMRARGQLNEMRSVDLGFSHAEAANFFVSVVGTKLDTQEIEMLENRTEGWVAGLQLAGLALQGRDNPSEFITDFAGDHTYIVDYLGEEVFKQQPQEIRDFLLKTSILTRLTPDLCDAVTKSKNAQESLEQLRQSNLFLIPLDDRHKWYRYHHLFADLLLHFLQREYPQQIPELHHRASIWYEEHNLIDDALQHALFAHDYDYVADMIQTYGLERIAQRQFTFMQKCIDELPERLFRQRPYLSVLQAWNSTALSQPISDVEMYLHRAESVLNGINDSNLVQKFKGEMAMIRGYSARRQRQPSLALQLLEEASRLMPKDNMLVQCFLNLDISGAYWVAGRFAEMENALQRTLTFPYQGGMKVAIINATADLAELNLHYGQLQTAIEICEQYTKLEPEKDSWVSSPYLYYIYARLGLALYERNDVDRAFDILHHASIAAQRIVNLTTTILSLTALTWLKLRQGYPNEAMELWKDVQRVYEKQPLFYGDFEFDYHQVRLWLAQGNLEAASDWAYHYTQNQTGRTNWNIRLDMVLARVRIAEKHLDEAVHILKSALKEAKANKLIGWLIQGLIVQAIAYDKKRQKDSALHSLAQALSLAEPEGYIRTFVDEGIALAELLSDLIANYRYYSNEFVVSVKYASELLAIINEESQNNLLYEQLTERELDVLRLLAAGFSNQDVAEKLYITLGTVKQYNHIIYRKLEVSTRKEAVQRAIELNLL